MAVKKTLAMLVLSVPAAALAQAPAVPTLDKVLEASGISMSGYIDAGYTHANRDIERGFSPRVFDSFNDSFVLNQVGLQIAKQPKSGVGGLVNVTAGRDAGVVRSFGANESTWDLTQGYLQYATGPLTAIAGKFTTLQGMEVIWSPANANYSRSLIMGSTPFTHTGVRGTYAASDRLSLIAGLNNGWDQLQDQNRSKTLELAVTAAPVKPLSLTASYYGGKEVAGPAFGNAIGQTSLDGRRDSFNFIANYTVTERLSTALDALYVKQKDSVFKAGSPSDGKYSAIAAYLTYAFMPKLKLALRAEALSDKDGLRFPTAAAIAGTQGTKHKEITATLAYAAADDLEVRFEVRQDRADQAVYSDNGGLSRSLLTCALQGLYKF